MCTEENQKLSFFYSFLFVSLPQFFLPIPFLFLKTPLLCFVVFYVGFLKFNKDFEKKRKLVEIFDFGSFCGGWGLEICFLGGFSVMNCSIKYSGNNSKKLEQDVVKII